MYLFYSRVTFPDSTSDTRLDILARSSLFSVGLNYRHGTGHGIGVFGLVHESPIQVRKTFEIIFSIKFVIISAINLVWVKHHTILLFYSLLFAYLAKFSKSRCQFHQHSKSSFCADILAQTKNMSTKKLFVKHSCKKAAQKMLVKWTTGVVYRMVPSTSF